MKTRNHLLIKILFAGVFLFTTLPLRAIIEITATVHAHAGMCDGEITTYTNGTAGPFMVTLYLVDNGTISPVETKGPTQGNLIFSNLCAGDYQIGVTGEMTSCEITRNTTINDCPPISIDDPISTEPSACDAADGGFRFLTSPQGGTGPYSYLWNNGITTRDNDNLPPGVYTLTITDAIGCKEEFTYELTAFSVPEVAPGLITETCEGTNSGSIQLDITSPSMDLSFLWNNNATTRDIYNLSAGTYCVTVTDNTSQCTATDCYTVGSISSNGPIVLTGTATPDCAGGYGSGAVSLTISGGTPPFQYQWTGDSPWLFGPNLYDVSTGEYCVTVSDHCGEEATACFQVEEIIPSITLENLENTCIGYNQGSIDISVSGYPSTPEYNWGGNTSQDISGLSADTYCVTITHGACNEQVQCFTVGEDALDEPVTIGYNGQFWLLTSGEILFQPHQCIQEIRCHGEVVDMTTTGITITAAPNPDGATCTLTATCNGSTEPIVITNSAVELTGEITADDNGCYRNDYCQYIDNTISEISYIFQYGYESEYIGDPQISYEWRMIGGVRKCVKIFTCGAEIANQIVVEDPFCNRALNAEDDNFVREEIYTEQDVFDLNIEKGTHSNALAFWGTSKIKTSSLTRSSNRKGDFIQTPSLLVQNIYPNPFSDYLQVEYRTPENTNLVTIVIYNLYGQEVFRDRYTVKMRGDTLTVDLSHLNSGIYQLILTDQKGNHSSAKVVKINN